MIYEPCDKGQALVEYALILALMAVVTVVVLSILGSALGNLFSNVVASNSGYF